MKLLLLLFFCHFSFSEKHTLSVLFTVSSEVQAFPEVIAVVQVDGVQVLYWDSNIKKVEPRQDWMKKLIEDDPQHSESLTQDEQIIRDQLTEVMQHLRQTEGVHVLQIRSGCEWDDETAAVNSVRQYGYDGVDFIKLDMKTQKWVALKPEADIIKQDWDKGTENNMRWTNHDTNICPQWLKKYLDLGNSSLHTPGKVT
ncbi:class I histocompatibility antigen, F10 alpha chain-like [Sphaeramia orbicularis]|uniref:class I histocompatibility antigen, F10 alpha chain-like n=1 Tax=Sphaeramia orbicularis TaxID=375764 RepID=UPI00117DE7B3|nr:class I histocompatibility antigen, F10 alpha chain-like [Sphaeramia orbicularis]